MTLIVDVFARYVAAPSPAPVVPPPPPPPPPSPPPPPEDAPANPAIPEHEVKAAAEAEFQKRSELKAKESLQTAVNNTAPVWEAETKQQFAAAIEDTGFNQNWEVATENIEDLLRITYQQAKARGENPEAAVEAKMAEIRNSSPDLPANAGEFLDESLKAIKQTVMTETDQSRKAELDYTLKQQWEGEVEAAQTEVDEIVASVVVGNQGWDPTSTANHTAAQQRLLLAMNNYYTAQENFQNDITSTYNIALANQLVADAKQAVVQNPSTENVSRLAEAQRLADQAQKGPVATADLERLATDGQAVSALEQTGKPYGASPETIDPVIRMEIARLDEARELLLELPNLPTRYGQDPSLTPFERALSQTDPVTLLALQRAGLKLDFPTEGMAPDAIVAKAQEELAGTLANPALDADTFLRNYGLLAAIPDVRRSDARAKFDQYWTSGNKAVAIQVLVSGLSAIGSPVEAQSFVSYVTGNRFSPEALQAEIDLIHSKPDILPSPKKGELAWLHRNDPTTLLVAEMAGVTIDFNDPNPLMRALAVEEPFTYVLLKSTGADRTIAPPTGWPPSGVTVSHEIALAEARRQLPGAIQSIKPDEAKRFTLIVDLTNDARINHTTREVTSHVSAGNHAEAITVLSVNLDASLTPEDRFQLWQAAGEPVLGRTYLDALLQGAIDKGKDSGNDPLIIASKVGTTLNSTFAGDVPPEMANIMLDLVQSKVGNDFSKTDQDHGASMAGSFYTGLSRVLTIANQRPNAHLPPPPDQSTPAPRSNEVASWLLRPGGASLMPHFLNTGYGEDTVFAGVREAGKEGSTDLNAAVLGILQQNPAAVRDDNGKSILPKFTKAAEGGVQVLQDQQFRLQAAAQYAEFAKDPMAHVQPLLDGMMNDPLISETTRLPEAGPERDNFIGKVLGLTPVDEQSAKDRATWVDWYTVVPPGSGTSSGEAQQRAEQNRKIIDKTIGWIIEIGGENAELRAVPAVYAAKEAGVQQVGLFRVWDGDASDFFVDGSVAAQAVAGQDPPWKYSSFNDFQNDNRLADHGKLYLPKAALADQALPAALSWDSDGDRRADITLRDAANETGKEQFNKFADPIIATLAVGASVALVAGTGGLATPLTVIAAGSAWGAWRSGDTLRTMKSHGQNIWDLGNSEVRLNWIGLGASLFSVPAMRPVALAKASFAAVQPIGPGSTLLSRQSLWNVLSSRSAQSLAYRSVFLNQPTVAGSFLRNPFLARALAFGSGVVSTLGGIGAMGETGHALFKAGDQATALDVYMFGTGAAGFAAGPVGRRIGTRLDEGAHVDSASQTSRPGFVPPVDRSPRLPARGDHSASDETVSPTTPIEQGEFRVVAARFSSAEDGAGNPTMRPTNLVNSKGEVLPWVSPAELPANKPTTITVPHHPERSLPVSEDGAPWQGTQVTLDRTGAIRSATGDGNPTPLASSHPADTPDPTAQPRATVRDPEESPAFKVRFSSSGREALLRDAPSALGAKPSPTREASTPQAEGRLPRGQGDEAPTRAGNGRSQKVPVDHSQEATPPASLRGPRGSAPIVLRAPSGMVRPTVQPPRLPADIAFRRALLQADIADQNVQEAHRAALLATSTSEKRRLATEAKRHEAVREEARTAVENAVARLLWDRFGAYLPDGRETPVTTRGKQAHLGSAIHSFPDRPVSELAMLHGFYSPRGNGKVPGVGEVVLNTDRMGLSEAITLGHELLHHHTDPAFSSEFHHFHLPGRSGTHFSFLEGVTEYLTAKLFGVATLTGGHETIASYADHLGGKVNTKVSYLKEARAVEDLVKQNSAREDIQALTEDTGDSAFDFVLCLAYFLGNQRAINEIKAILRNDGTFLNVSVPPPPSGLLGPAHPAGRGSSAPDGRMSPDEGASTEAASGPMPQRRSAPRGETREPPGGLSAFIRHLLMSRSKFDRSTIYDQYTRRSQSSEDRLTTSSTSFLGALLNIMQSRPQGARAYSQSQSRTKPTLAVPLIEQAIGFGRRESSYSLDDAGRDFFHFHGAGNRPAARERIYINASADHALNVMKYIVREVVDKRGADGQWLYPGVRSAKIAGPDMIADRRENIVLYVDAPETQNRVLEAIARYHDENPTHFLPETPFLTEHYLPGVAVAAEPSQSMQRKATVALVEEGLFTPDKLTVLAGRTSSSRSTQLSEAELAALARDRLDFDPALVSRMQQRKDTAWQGEEAPRTLSAADERQLAEAARRTLFPEDEVRALERDGLSDADVADLLIDTYFSDRELAGTASKTLLGGELTGARLTPEEIILGNEEISHRFSFGSLRSAAIALARLDLPPHLTPDDPAFVTALHSSVRDRFRDFGIDPDRPARNLPDDDGRDVPTAPSGNDKDPFASAPRTAPEKDTAGEPPDVEPLADPAPPAARPRSPRQDEEEPSGIQVRYSSPGRAALLHDASSPYGPKSPPTPEPAVQQSEISPSPIGREARGLPSTWSEKPPISPSDRGGSAEPAMPTPAGRYSPKRKLREMMEADRAIRSEIGAYLRGRLRPAIDAMRFLADTAFAAERSRRFGSNENIAAFTTTSRLRPGRTRIVMRADAHGTGEVFTAAHEMVHYYTSRAFRRLARDYRDIDGGRFNTLNEGAAEYLAWRLTAGRDKADTPGAYRDHVYDEVLNGLSPEDAESAYLFDAIDFERIFQAMGKEQAYEAVFRGDRAALARFRALAEESTTHARAPDGWGRQAALPKINRPTPNKAPDFDSPDAVAYPTIRLPRFLGWVRNEHVNLGRDRFVYVLSVPISQIGRTHGKLAILPDAIQGYGKLAAGADEIEWLTPSDTEASTVSGQFGPPPEQHVQIFVLCDEAPNVVTQDGLQAVPYFNHLPAPWPGGTYVHPRHATGFLGGPWRTDRGRFALGWPHVLSDMRTLGNRVTGHESAFQVEPDRYVSEHGGGLIGTAPFPMQSDAGGWRAADTHNHLDPFAKPNYITLKTFIERIVAGSAPRYGIIDGSAPRIILTGEAIPYITRANGGAWATYTALDVPEVTSRFGRGFHNDRKFLEYWDALPETMTVKVDGAEVVIRPREMFIPSLTGIEMYPLAPGERYGSGLTPAQHIDHLLLEFPGAFPMVGELTLWKEMKTIMDGRRNPHEIWGSKDIGETAATINRAAELTLEELRDAQLVTVLHNDYSLMEQGGRDGRPVSGPGDSRHFYPLMNMLMRFGAYDTSRIRFDDPGYILNAAEVKEIVNHGPVRMPLNVITAHFGLGNTQRATPHHVELLKQAMRHPLLEHVRYDSSWLPSIEALIQKSHFRPEMIELIRTGKVFYGGDVVNFITLEQLASPWFAQQKMLKQLYNQDPQALAHYASEGFLQMYEAAKPGVEWRRYRAWRSGRYDEFISQLKHGRAEKLKDWARKYEQRILQDHSIDLTDSSAFTQVMLTGRPPGQDAFIHGLATSSKITPVTLGDKDVARALYLQFTERKSVVPDTLIEDATGFAERNGLILPEGVTAQPASVKSTASRQPGEKIVDAWGKKPPFSRTELQALKDLDGNPYSEEAIRVGDEAAKLGLNRFLQMLSVWTVEYVENRQSIVNEHLKTVSDRRVRNIRIGLLASVALMLGAPALGAFGVLPYPIVAASMAGAAGFRGVATLLRVSNQHLNRKCVEILTEQGIGKGELIEFMGARIKRWTPQMGLSEERIVGRGGANDQVKQFYVDLLHALETPINETVGETQDVRHTYIQSMANQFIPMLERPLGTAFGPIEPFNFRTPLGQAVSLITGIAYSIGALGSAQMLMQNPLHLHGVAHVIGSIAAAALMSANTTFAFNHFAGGVSGHYKSDWSQLPKVRKMMNRGGWPVLATGSGLTAANQFAGGQWQDAALSAWLTWYTGRIAYMGNVAESGRGVSQPRKFPRAAAMAAGGLIGLALLNMIRELTET